MITRTMSIEELLLEVERQDDSAHKLELLLAACRKLYNVDPPRALELAERAYHMARATGNRAGMALGLRWRGTCHHFMEQPAAALALLTRAVALLDALGNNDEKMVAMDYLARSYVGVGNNDEAIRCFTTTLQYYSSLGNERNVAITLSGMANVYGHSSCFTKALELSKQSMEIWIRLGDRLWQSRVMLHIGGVYDLLGDFDRALEHYLKGLELWKPQEFGPGEAAMLANIGITYSAKGEFVQAMEYLDQAEEIYERCCNRIGQALVQAHRARVYVALGHRDVAAELARISTDHALAGEGPDLAFVYETLGEVYRLLDDPDRTVRALEKGLEVATSTYQQFRLHELLSAHYERRKDFYHALEHHRTYSTLKDEVDRTASRLAMVELQERMRTERVENERELLTLKNGRLELELSTRLRELSAMSLGLERQQILLDRLQSRIELALRTCSGSERDLLLELMNEIRIAGTGPDTYHAFVGAVDRIQEDFTRMLTQRYPSLSVTELKVCALLRGNLSTKEIAELLSVSTRNIDSHRYNIRKKTKLASNISLPKFLASLEPDSRS